MKKVNILFLVHHLSMGGIQKNNVEMINNINREKFNVFVLYQEKGILYDLLSKDISISYLGKKANYKSIRFYVNIIKMVKYIKDNNIDLVHSIDGLLYYSGAIASKITGIKHIRTQPYFISRHEPKNAKFLKYTPFEKWTDKFITYNYASAKDLEIAGVCPEKIETNYGFFRIDEYLEYKPKTNIREQFGIPENHKIIVAIHRMVPLKGYETFIDMIPLILKKYKNVSFLLVGDGPMRSSYEQRVADLGVKDNVIFTGFQKELSNITKQIDFGVYPLADTAAMGSVIRSSKVLITKKNSSMDEYIINGSTGFLSVDDTPESYASYSLKLLNDEDLVKVMENNQKKFVLKNFDGVNNLKQLEILFESIVQNKK